MSERKPKLESIDSFVDRQIKEAQARGEFDNLPGAGKPLPDLDAPHDDMWWVKKLVKREGISVLPPALELRRDVERALVGILRRQREADVRKDVEALNAKIRAMNAHATTGPSLDIGLIDADAVIERWRRR